MGEDGAVSCYPASVTEHVPGRKHLPAVPVGGVDRGPWTRPGHSADAWCPSPSSTVDIQAGSLSGDCPGHWGAKQHSWPPLTDARSTANCDNTYVPRHALCPLAAGSS